MSGTVYRPSLDPIPTAAPAGAEAPELEVTVTASRIAPPEPKFRPEASQDLALVVGNRAWRGWQEIRVTRGVEQMPSDFDLASTEDLRGGGGRPVLPSEPCKIEVLGQLVLTGYVDRYSPQLSASSHSVSYQGRSKCADLVDSSAIFQDESGADLPTQISGASALEIATRLCRPHGVTVTAPDGPGPVIPQHNAELTESPYEIVERIARFSRFLAYDDAEGNLVLAQVGKRRHSSGVEQGKNLEAAACTFSWDQRFTTYDVILFAQNNLGDLTAATGGDPGWNVRARVEDPSSTSKRADGEPRVRRRVIVVERQDNGIQLAIDRAKWEAARRYGRSQAVRVTVDDWVDSSGTLWQPNWLVPLHLPALHIVGVEWPIVEVTYRRGEDGTHADLVLMPPEALEPAPILLQPFNSQIARALADG